NARYSCGLREALTTADEHPCLWALALILFFVQRGVKADAPIMIRICGGGGLIRGERRILHQVLAARLYGVFELFVRHAQGVSMPMAVHPLLFIIETRTILGYGHRAKAHREHALEPTEMGIVRHRATRETSNVNGPGPRGEFGPGHTSCSLKIIGTKRFSTGFFLCCARG